MAKRKEATGEAKGGVTKSKTSGATTADAMEQRLVDFAEQLGRVAGTVQSKAEGWTNRDALYQQIASVRDGAVDLLERLARASGVSTRKPAAGARGASKRRSGGVVDAPGKKHRKPAPADPSAKIAESQSARRRAATTMVKTVRHRARG